MDASNERKQHTATALRNGLPATAEDLAPLAFAGYAHFTAMQVRGGAVRGLDLHLQRLRTASLTLFGQALPDEEVRAALRAVLPLAPEDFSLIATLYSPAGEFTVAGLEAVPQILVRTLTPSSGPAGPLSLAMFDHERTLAEIKHVGEVAKTWFLREAAAQGFDDAAFVDRDGRISEGSIWNLAFWDGQGVVWPRAAMLRGTTLGIVMRQLERLGIPQTQREIRAQDLPALSGAVVMNSWSPGIAVHRIGAVDLPEAPAFVDLLHRAYLGEPPTSL
ncbi:aminotransferase class IV family protein [Variovorax sp. LT1R16]|uniref:aminotransferase class IV family protein n=1 Tax=Variovorax sp. LT1R16 TaxID=3443728 RepID=UPI003F4789B5